MSEISYKYNPETLQFESADKSCKTKIFNFIIILISGLFLVTVFTLFYSSNFTTLKYKKLQEQNQELVFRYVELQNNINNIEQNIDEIANRDDHIYRTILEEDPLPANLRNAGFGGANKFKEFEKYDNADLLISVSQEVEKIANKLKIQQKSYEDVSHSTADWDKMNKCIPAIQPISIKDFCRISSYFGRRIDPISGIVSMHKGLDFPANMNTNIYSTGEGVVIETMHSRTGYGNEIVIAHHGGYTTRYAHLNKILVKEGDKVQRGDLIGLLGNSGKSTGPHLHYEVRLHNVPLNPRNFYNDDLNSEEFEQIVKFARSDKSANN